VQSTPRLSEILAIVAGLFATGWLGWRHIGPYRWLSDAQAMAFDGSYYPFLSWLVLFLLLAGPLIGLARLVPFGPTVDMSRLVSWWTMYPRHFQTTLLAVMGVLAGSFLATRATFMGARVEASLAGLERAEEVPSWVRVSDFELDVLGAIEVSSDRVYVPLLVPGGEGPPEFFAKLTESEWEARAHGEPLEGLLEEDGLPNEVRVAYTDSGYIADPYWVLDVGETPESERTMGLVILGAGAVFGLLAFGYWARVMRNTF
jgi:hypothetical protein